VTYPPNRRLLQHLRTERPALFTCVRRADVEATNWQAEQAIRPAVVTRKVCGGNRSPRGAATQAIVASVLRTSVQQHRDPLVLLVALQRSPRPIVADLRLPGPAPPSPDLRAAGALTKDEFSCVLACVEKVKPLCLFVA